MIQRRHFSTATALALTSAFSFTPARGRAATDLSAQLQQLEATAQGRLGVYILDTATGQSHGHRADERFMMLSSFKALASALVLARVDRGQESLERRITYAKSELVTYSPVTERFADTAQGMSLAGLCEATITTSDNSAANFILDSYGGPAALTAFARLARCAPLAQRCASSRSRCTSCQVSRRHCPASRSPSDREPTATRFNWSRCSSFAWRY